MHYGEPNALSLLRELVRARGNTRRSLTFRDVSHSCELGQHNAVCQAFYQPNRAGDSCAACPLVCRPDPAAQMPQYFSRQSQFSESQYCGYRHLLINLTDPDAAILSQPILERFTQEFGESAVQTAMSQHLQKDPNPL